MVGEAGGGGFNTLTSKQQQHNAWSEQQQHKGG